MNTANADADDAVSFVLFDPADAPARLYRGPAAVRRARTDAEVVALRDWVGDELAAGREVALFLDFEASRALAGLPLAHAARDDDVAQALSFDAVQLLAPDAVDAWLDARADAGIKEGDGDARDGAERQPAGLAGWRRGITRDGYGRALDRIAALLAAGDCYQIDFTFAMHARAFGHPAALYRRLRQRQPTAYRCLARLPGRWVLSLSPELFFTLAPGGGVRVRPMKGTAPRAADPRADAAAARALAADAKNRAENLMILDLLRNDLGRVARPGSVQVPARFAVEAHPAVWQMTSTAEAVLAPDTGWDALWAALFPCGSVVGAPKHRAMDILGSLEAGARGLYTGAIGWLAPARGADTDQAGWAAGSPHATQGVFSVAIRTLELGACTRHGTRAARMGLGSGIVVDSTPESEWRECLLKGRFATALDPGFGLIETFTWPEGVPLAVCAAPHWRRLARSARYFGFRFPRGDIEAELAARRATASEPLRVRVCLRHDGTFDVSVGPLAPMRGTGDVRVDVPVDVLLARDVVDDAVLDPHDLFLKHKTTHRARFDAAWRAAEALGAFDALFFNRRGELCEGGRSSVFLRLDGQWLTPPLRCGLLPGVTRARLLADPAMQAREQVLHAQDLARAEELMLCNALRGALRARLRAEFDAPRAQCAHGPSTSTLHSSRAALRAAAGAPDRIRGGK